jgi:hypothetical protein
MVLPGTAKAVGTFLLHACGGPRLPPDVGVVDFYRRTFQGGVSPRESGKGSWAYRYRLAWFEMRHRYCLVFVVNRPMPCLRCQSRVCFQRVAWQTFVTSMEKLDTLPGLRWCWNLSRNARYSHHLHRPSKCLRQPI